MKFSSTFHAVSYALKTHLGRYIWRADDPQCSPRIFNDQQLQTDAVRLQQCSEVIGVLFGKRSTDVPKSEAVQKINSNMDMFGGIVMELCDDKGQ